MSETPLMTIFKCTRPVVFETGFPDYPYSLRGTAFIVRFLGLHFVLTAAHVIRDFEASQVRFQYHPNSPDFIPLKRLYRIHGDDADDSDQYDIVVFLVNEQTLDPVRFQGYFPYDLQPVDALTIYNSTANYAFRGFPTHLRETEYELRRIKMQSMLGDAKYERRSSRNQMHVIRVNRVAEIGDFDGLSGSPVFQINHIDGRYSSEAFAGMVLRGTATAGTLEFLEHGKVISVLTKIVDGDVKEDTTA